MRFKGKVWTCTNCFQHVLFEDLREAVERLLLVELVDSLFAPCCIAESDNDRGDASDRLLQTKIFRRTCPSDSRQMTCAALRHSQPVRSTSSSIHMVVGASESFRNIPYIPVVKVASGRWPRRSPVGSAYPAVQPVTAVVVALLSREHIFAVTSPCPRCVRPVCR